MNRCFGMLVRGMEVRWSRLLRFGYESGTGEMLDRADCEARDGSYILLTLVGYIYYTMFLKVPVILPKT
jgi:hypothetical protein